jgi:malic enzyme
MLAVVEWSRGYSKFGACNVVPEKLDKISRITDYNPDQGTTGILMVASVLAG